MGPTGQSQREYAEECLLPLASVEPFPAKLGGDGREWEAGAWPGGGQHVLCPSGTERGPTGRAHRQLLGPCVLL